MITTINAIESAPDFEGPSSSEFFGGPDGSVVIEVDDFNDGVGRAICFQNADFIFLHGRLPGFHNGTDFTAPVSRFVQRKF